MPDSSTFLAIAKHLSQKNSIKNPTFIFPIIDAIVTIIGKTHIS